jgi:hypothetical protein
MYGMVAYIYNLSTTIGRQRQEFKSKHSKTLKKRREGWQSGSSGRMPAKNTF